SGGQFHMARLFSTLMALAFAATVVSAQANIAGAWELSINGPEGVITASADLKQDGDNVTGTITSPQGTVELKGTYKAKKVELAFTIAGPQGELPIKVNGDVDGSEMKGIIDFGMGMADFTAKKK
ncbi:MAG TPA: hypothetical protein VFZ38_14555, partial [Vicinamibacterales bacterium]